MSARLVQNNGYELESHTLLGSDDHFDSDADDLAWRHGAQLLPWLGRRLLKLSAWPFNKVVHDYPLARNKIQHWSFSRRRKYMRRYMLFLHIVLGTIVALICLTGAFWPSYTHLPPHYQALIDQVKESEAHGRGNPRNEKIYIAAALYDPQGGVANGPWGNALLELIELLGEENVFLSIYENNSGEQGEHALRLLADHITCNFSIVSDPDLSLEGLPRVVVPGGEERIRRIDYLADVRNRALRPLDAQMNENKEVKYDKLLYLNDVIFNPVEALQLLFCTNADAKGQAQYRAACAVDFSNAFKFYDTYATRDLQGYGIGLPFYPWFTTSGSSQSRRDVLEQRDAVRVRSCWGGMVAFDARFFQGRNPVRFRADPELFWDASECCLIHADLQDTLGSVDDFSDTGSYMNPYIRVAYDSRSYAWLWANRRFERLYPVIHDVLNRLVGLPWDNPRRSQVPGEKVEETVWVPSSKGEGKFQTVERVARNDGFCGRRGLEVIVENRQPGEDGFEAIRVP